MTLITFFGCAFTAYGPSLAIFFGSIAPNAQLVILMVSSAFFWLISVLLASAIWFMASNSRETFPVTIIYTVLLQELFRYFLFLLINRAEGGLNLVAKHPKSRFNRSGYAFAAGLGFGLMFGIISYITPLVDSMGPGVLIDNNKHIDFAPLCLDDDLIHRIHQSVMAQDHMRHLHQKLS
ncbi:gamma secretase complex protein [Linnemannia exigua]|uniref:Gamma secretase complex protein n=1 Tax=Linnemannia exigua TaxID=604196 RepID=A0AAD4D5H5_9FUNG|nr:gamma secretase complex protein [Linnemannia exigua]